MDKTLLAKTAAAMVARGKGVLAADESSGTCEKRFKSVNVECTEENRRAYRGLLFTTPGAEQYVSGVILFDETIRQKTNDGVPFPAYLAGKGILPGIKVDKGAQDLALCPGEKVTEGLVGLRAPLGESFQPQRGAQRGGDRSDAARHLRRDRRAQRLGRAPDPEDQHGGLGQGQRAPGPRRRSGRAHGARAQAHRARRAAGDRVPLGRAVGPRRDGAPQRHEQPEGPALAADLLVLARAAECRAEGLERQGGEPGRGAKGVPPPRAHERPRRARQVEARAGTAGRVDERRALRVEPEEPAASRARQGARHLRRGGRTDARR